MPTSFYFDQYENSAEQQLFEDLAVESIQINGINVYYLPRKSGSVDDLYGEDSLQYFDEASLVDMYIKNVDGFGGQGDFMSSSYMEIRDTITFVVARKSWMEDVGNLDNRVRPLEGDLIFFPLNRKLFKVSFVEHESVFYLGGALYVWELRCELFEYSGEVFDTGIPEIDELDDKFGINLLDGGIEMEIGDAAVLEELNGVPILTEDGVLSGGSMEAMNDFFETEGDSIIDFTCVDPFVAPDGTY